MIRHSDNDTIVAISTPLGEGALGVIRLSGRRALSIADTIFLAKSKKPVCEQPHLTAQYGHVISRGESAAPEIIDEVLLLVMRAPKSYTCEDVVEISAHGGPAVLQAILRLAIASGARLAEKGEFTKRAFLNGRLDLLQAEGVLDLVKAKTELGRAWAVSQLEGGLSKKIQGFKKELIDILSHLEASIDFPDDFLEPHSLREIQRRFETLSNAIQKCLSSSNIGLIVKKGLKVVITGLPNVGKSSLMNQLVRHNRVIVTPYPGTTRDVVEEEIQIQGFPIRLLDTAGIQDTCHPIEKEGIDRTKRAVLEADLILYVVDSSQAPQAHDQELCGGLADRKKIIVLNKTDLPQRTDRNKFEHWFSHVPEDSIVGIVESSCLQEPGTEKLEEKILSFITQGKAERSDEVVVSSLRQKDLLEKVSQALRDAEQACRDNRSPELIALDVRLALDNLGILVGEVLTDDILDALFSQFCIGK